MLDMACYTTFVSTITPKGRAPHVLTRTGPDVLDDLMLV